MLAVGFGLSFVGSRLVGSNPPHGFRAGIAVGIAMLFLVGLIVQAIGIQIEWWSQGKIVGLIIWAIVAAVLLFFSLRAFFRPGFGRWLGRVEDQGWFTTAPYKRSQGLRVRRGTIIGVLALAGCGIYTMLNRNPLSGDWDLAIPFVNDWDLTILPYKRYTLTLLLAAGALWFAWRVVNYPAFADFLIATEAEMNKVSWTTRKRLVQDTIVVLTTVLLLTLFLFFVDILWFKILSNPLIKVLQVDTTTQTTSDGSEKPEY
jgi:preprotein translocase SecE subunit